MPNIINRVCWSRPNTLLTDVVEAFMRFTDIPGETPGVLWVAFHSAGYRQVKGEQEFWVDDPELCGGWGGYPSHTVWEVEFRSASSGSSLKWEGDPGQPGTLTFTQGCDPSYLGAYWQAFNDACKMSDDAEFWRRNPMKPSEDARAAARAAQAEREARLAAAAAAAVAE